MSWTRFNWQERPIGGVPHFACARIASAGMVPHARISCDAERALLWGLSGALGVLCYFVCDVVKQFMGDNVHGATESAYSALWQAEQVFKHSEWLKANRKLEAGPS